MTQSRQAIIGLVVAIIFVVLRRGVHGRSRCALLLLIPAAWLITTTVIDQVQSQNQFNSLYQRLDWFKEVYAFWKQSPIFGHGLRYWYTDVASRLPAAAGRTRSRSPRPASSGCSASSRCGSASSSCCGASILDSGRSRSPRSAAASCRRSSTCSGSPAQVSIPFVIAGICLGAQALDADPGEVGRRDRARSSDRFTTAAAAEAVRTGCAPDSTGGVTYDGATSARHWGAAAQEIHEHWRAHGAARVSSRLATSLARHLPHDARRSCGGVRLVRPADARVPGDRDRAGPDQSGRRRSRTRIENLVLGPQYRQLRRRRRFPPTWRWRPGRSSPTASIADLGLQGEPERGRLTHHRREPAGDQHDPRHRDGRDARGCRRAR